MSHYNFNQNKACEYFPCHKTEDPENFSCLFCYCPLYALGEECGGHFKYTAKGIKDCSDCLIPHKRENYSYIMGKMPLILKMAMRNEASPESSSASKNI